jgi:hypothetical protein
MMSRANLGAEEVPLSTPKRALNERGFDFISENTQIASVREFMQSLPETLRS